jgi:dinuclear metal center YbgI/SA1388 family protein
VKNRMMQAKAFSKWMNAAAPAMLQESYDNSGWIVQQLEEYSAALCCLDVNPEIIAEAKSRGCNLIICHHPLIFKGLKRIGNSTSQERSLVEAIKAGIDIYACHTNLDNLLHQGVNGEIARRLGLQETQILAPRKGELRKLATYIPASHFEQVRDALFHAGAGEIGNYSNCSFSWEGEGTFKPGAGSNPFSGAVEELSTEAERRLEVLLPLWKVNEVMQALRSAHPYEEIAYELLVLDNVNTDTGSGLIGSLPEEIDLRRFIELVKKELGNTSLRYKGIMEKTIKKVAVCGGSGAFLIGTAGASGADVYLTGDIKYHEWFDAPASLALVDCGHYESEQFTPIVLAEIIQKKFPTFAVFIAETNTNPVKYY